MACCTGRSEKLNSTASPSGEASRSGASAEAVQRFVAYGQLCHLIVATGLTADDGPWAATLTAGIRHF